MISRWASQQCWGVTAGKARHKSSNVTGVTAGKVRHNSSECNGGAGEKDDTALAGQWDAIWLHYYLGTDRTTTTKAATSVRKQLGPKNSKSN